jgi:hypothetical protein
MIGELELYHGSDAEFKEFNAAYIKHSHYGWGFSFSTDIDMASSCGDNIYTIELPDDAKLFNMDENDREDEFYQLFVNDIESYGIDEGFINLGVSTEPGHKFYERFWAMQANYKKLLGMSETDAMKRLTELIKSMGYIGTIHQSVIVLFDKESFKIKNVQKVEESVSLKDIISKTLNESLSQRAYHFTTLKKYHQIVDSDSIIFSTPFGEDLGINIDYGRGARYYLSTTRIRDGRVGYSEGLNTRIELNSDFFNNNYHSGPVNFFAKSISRDNGGNGFDANNQRQTENEDRIYSNKRILTGITRFITRVDIYIPIKDLSELKNHYYDIYTMLRDIYNSDMGLKTFVYNNAYQFNIQGNNITNELLEIL